MLTLPLGLLVAVSLHPAALQETAGDPLERIRRDPILARLKLEEIAGAGAFRLYHALPPRDPAAQRVQVEALFAPWLEALGKHFEGELWPTLGVAGPSGLSVVVTARESIFRSLVATRATRIPRWERCAWHPKSEALITFHEARKRTPPTPVRRNLLRHAALRLLLTGSQAGEEPVGLWALEGLAAVVAEHQPGQTPDVLGAGGVPTFGVEFLTEPLTDEQLRRAYLLPIAELASTAGSESRHLALSRTNLAAGVPACEEDVASVCVRAQGELLVHYLAFRPGAEHREGLMRYVAEVLAGRGGAEDLEQALGVDPSSLDVPFRKWAVALARERAQRAKPTPEKPIAEQAGSGAQGDPGPAADPTRDLPEGPRAWPLEGARHPALLPVARDLESQLASALARAVEGELDAAIAFLEATEKEVAPEDAQRLAVERARLVALRDLRSEFLASLPGTRGRLRLVEGEEKLVSPVESIDGGVILLGRNRWGGVSVAVDSIGAADLRASLGRKADDFAPAWLVAYVELLAGDPEWQRTLTGSGAEVAALRDQGPALGDLLPAARRLRELATLAIEPLPKRSEELRALLERAAALAPTLPEGGAGGARPALRGLAWEAARALFEQYGIQLAMKGEVEHLGGGKIRLTYDFDDPDQLKDFVDDPEPAYWLYGKSTVEGPGRYEVREGALKFTGSRGLRLTLPVAQPTVRYSVQFTDPLQLDLEQFFYLVIGIDDETGYHACAFNCNDLVVYDPQGVRESAREDRGVTVHKPVRLVLQHLEDGSVSMQEGDAELRFEGCQELGRGIGIRFRGEFPVQLLDLQVEGTVTDEDWAAAGERWVAAELKRLGL